MQIDERQIVINRLKLSLSTKCLLSRFLDEYRNLMSVPKADECAMDNSGDKAVLQKQAILPEFFQTTCREKMGKYKQHLYQKFVLLS